MAVPFDHIATTFDAVVATSAVGQFQRKQVWNYLEHVFPQLEGLEMLELNNGSDEEALLFSDKGCNVVATDLSSQTLGLTQRKENSFPIQQGAYSHYIDIDNLAELNFDKKYDLIFSNFGGLNCVSPEALQKLFDLLPSMLNDKGRFIGVIMPKFCFFETMYFLAKLKFKKAFQRITSKEVLINKDGIPLRTWYYKPSQIIGFAKRHFDVIRTKPVGLVLPPAYLKNFFLRKKFLLNNLNKLENTLSKNSFYAGMADHFIIDLKRK